MGEADVQWERDLWVAAWADDRSVVEALLVEAKKHDINWQHPHYTGQTALHMAAARVLGSSSVDLLLAAGARLDSVDYEGNTPLHKAADWDCVEALARLLAAGAEIDAVNRHGHTALMQAVVGNRCPDTVKFLLDEGADMDRVNEQEGKTAYELAVWFNRRRDTLEVLEAYAHQKSKVRPALVACLGRVLPAELTELCADFVYFPPARRRLAARTTH